MKGGVLLLKLQYTHNETTFSSTTIIAGSRIYTLSIMYYQVDPTAQNHCGKCGKISGFSVIQILCEINFEDSRSAKSAILICIQISTF